MAYRRRIKEEYDGDKEYPDADFGPPDTELKQAAKKAENEGIPTVYILSELGQVPPPDYPFRWKEIAQTERPPHPEAEFVSSPYPLDLSALARRWEGLFTHEEIELSYFTQDWRRKRFDYQNKIAVMAVENSLATDVHFKIAQINNSIIELSATKQRLLADLEAGYEYDRSGNAGAMGYVKRPMSTRSKTALAAAIVAVDNALMTRVGVATQIHEENVNVKVGITRTLHETLEQNDEEYSVLMAIAQQASQKKQSDPLALEVGEPIPDVREMLEKAPMGTRVGGKTYQVEPDNLN